jgi:putative redox protein
MTGTTAAADFSLTLTWQGGQRFSGASAGASQEVSITLDGRREAGPSPVQAVGFALAGCMAIDVVDVLEKGRLPLKGLACDLRTFRSGETPRKIIGIDLHFGVTGDIPEDRVARAIQLSREKYCSVWHSLNPAIDFKTSFTVNP